ncbi:MAG TPA: PEGA domain-containing protein, partial [Thermoplasmata archaeon]|nr:PEGA domain-containing protein [Thermoplasmata archaeon]
SGVVNSANVTLSPGGYLHVVLGALTPYPVTALERGLPSGSLWTVHLATQEFHLRGPTVTVNLTNGTYPWSVDPVPGFTTPLYAGTVHVRGAAVPLWINFTQVVYLLTFYASGLPTGTTWEVTINGTTYSSLGTSLGVFMPNGSYAYQVDAGPIFLADPPSGILLVTGSPQSVFVTFALRPGFLVGSVNPAGATVSVAGAPVASAGGSFNVSLPPGIYDVQASLGGFAPYEENWTITPGNVTPLSVVLVPLPPPPGGGGGSGSSLPLDGSTLILLAVGVGAMAAVLIAFMLRRRRP